MSRSTTSPERLVCGLDGSDRASGVLSVAAELAERLGLVVGEGRDAVLRAGYRLLDRLDAGERADEAIVELGRPEELLRACLVDRAALAVVVVPPPAAAHAPADGRPVAAGAER